MEGEGREGCGGVRRDGKRKKRMGRGGKDEKGEGESGKGRYGTESGEGSARIFVHGPRVSSYATAEKKA